MAGYVYQGGPIIRRYCPNCGRDEDAEGVNEMWRDDDGNAELGAVFYCLKCGVSQDRKDVTPETKLMGAGSDEEE